MTDKTRSNTERIRRAAEFRFSVQKEQFRFQVQKNDLAVFLSRAKKDLAVFLSRAKNGLGSFRCHAQKNDLVVFCF